MSRAIIFMTLSYLPCHYEKARAFIFDDATTMRTGISASIIVSFDYYLRQPHSMSLMIMMRKYDAYFAFAMQAGRRRMISRRRRATAPLAYRSCKERATNSAYFT